MVFEFTSASTKRDDLLRKRFEYESLGVQEYFIFDPLDEYLKPRLQGFRLDGHFFAPLTPSARADGEWQLTSEPLGLELRTDGPRLRLFDPRAGEYLLEANEEAERRRAAESRAQYEADARRVAETEVARLRAELAQLKGSTP